MINLLNLDALSKNMVPVTTPEYISGKGNALHPEGLFSEVIFGQQESPERSKNFSFIELNCKIIHPALYVVFRRINKNVILAINKEKSFTISEDGSLVEKEDGEINGMKAIIDNFDKITFNSNDADIRNDMIQMLESYHKRDMLFLTKTLVIPASFREIEIDPIRGGIRVDPINEYYVKIIRLSIQLASMQSDEIYDVLSASMNKIVLELYNFISQKLAKKRGLVRSSMLGKRADFTARGVITGGSDEINIDEIGVPLRMLVKLYEPFIIYDLMSSGNVPTGTLSKALREFNQTTLSVLSVRGLLTGIYNGDELTKDISEIVTASVQRAIQGKVVMAKRDPAINTESVQAFRPVLVNGSTIKLNICKCGGFNADFDGDSCVCRTLLKYKTLNDVKEINVDISELEFDV